MNTRWDGLKGAWAKFDWAREHADALRAEILADTNTLTLTREEELYATDQPNVFVSHYIISEMPHAPREWGFRLGDIVHNLRCCLDYVGWQLAIYDSLGEPFRLTQFAICNDSDAFKAFQWHLKSLTDDHIAFVERCQPYKGLDGLKDGGDERLLPLVTLALLRDLNDGDKHQVPVVTLSVTSERGSLGLTNVVGCSRAEVVQIDSGTTLEPGTPILRVIIWNPDFSILDMDVEYHPSFDVVIAEGEPLPAVLMLMQQAVKDVMKGAETLLFGPPLGLA